MVYFFTDLDKLNDQTDPADAFGPLSDIQYRVNSKHTVLAGAKAYAVVDGLVFAQYDRGGGITLILKPTNQGGVNSLEINYILYRGVDPSSLIDSSGTGIQNTNPNDLSTKIRNAQVALNASRDRAAGDAAGTTIEEASVKALGIHFTASASGSDLRLDTDSVDSIFFNDTSDYKPTPVKAGESLGEFLPECGIEIWVASLEFIGNLGVVRDMDHVIVVPLMPSSPTASERMGNLSQREAIHNYLDPAALFGLTFFPGLLKAKYSSGTVYRFNNYDEILYTDLLIKFVNKDAVYIDIRSENSYSMNYYGNYGDSVYIRFGKTGTYYSQNLYETGWPIIIFRDSLVVPKFPTNTSRVTPIEIQFPKGDNTRPIVFIPPDPAFIHPRLGILFEEPIFELASAWTSPIELSFPNVRITPDTKLIAYYIRISYIRRFDEATSPSTASLVETRHFLDSVFPLVSTHVSFKRTFYSTSDKPSLSSFKYERFIDAEQSLGYSFVGDVVLLAEATRVMFVINPKYIHRSQNIIAPAPNPLTPASSGFGSRIFDIITSMIGFDGILKFAYNETIPTHTIESSPKREGYDQDAISPLLCLGMTTDEYDRLMAVAATFAPHTHHKFIRITGKEVKMDLDKHVYQTISLGVTGLDMNGIAIDQPTSPTVVAQSGKGEIFSTSDFSAAEPRPTLLPEVYVPWDIIQYMSPGGVVFRITGVPDTYYWELFQDVDGTPISYTPPIILSAGSRVVLLKKKLLRTSTDTVKEFFNVGTWSGGEPKFGYLDCRALIDAQSPRIYCPWSNILPGEVAIKSFYEDCLFFLKEAMKYRKFAEPGSSPAPYSASNTYDDLINKNHKKLTGFDCNGVPSGASSLKHRMDSAGGDWSSLISDYRNLTKNVQWFKKGDGTTTIFNMPSRFLTYLHPNFDPIPLIDKPGSMRDILAMSSFKHILRKRVGIIIYGEPVVGGGFTLSRGTLTPQPVTYSDNPETMKASIATAIRNLLSLSAPEWDAIGKEKLFFHSERVEDFGADVQSTRTYMILSETADPMSTWSTEHADEIVVSSNTMASSSGTVRVQYFSKIMAIPITKQFFYDYSSSDDPVMKELIDSTSYHRIEQQANYSTGEVFYATESGSGSIDIQSAAFQYLAKDLFAIRNEINGFLPTEHKGTKLSRDFQWLLENVVDDALLPGHPFFKNIDSTIWVGGKLWPDVDLISPNGREIGSMIYASLSQGVPIDQSMGFINSNPVISLLMHESTQGNLLWNYQEDLHISMEMFQEGFESVQSGGPLSTTNYQKRWGFFQFHPAHSIVEMAHFLSLMGL
jgi:hypothetical protein